MTERKFMNQVHITDIEECTRYFQGVNIGESGKISSKIKRSKIRSSKHLNLFISRSDAGKS